MTSSVAVDPPREREHPACPACDPHASVCITTFRRPHVAETLRSILAQAGLGSRAIEIIVADDDPGGFAKTIVEGIAATAPVEIRYVLSGAQNVAAARNACLDAARAPWIAFIDDDEIADPTWLANLLSVQEVYGADIVKGFVRGVYPGDTPDWIRTADPFTRDYGRIGQRLRRFGAGNVLIRRSLIADHRMRFDPSFGRTGGEDADFLRRIVRFGGYAISAPDAIVQEIVPSHRVSLEYLGARFKRMGQLAGHRIRGRTGEESMASLAVAVAAAGLSSTYLIFRPFAPRFAFKLFSKFWYCRGVLEGAAGRPVNEMAP